MFRSKRIYFGPEHSVLMMIDSEKSTDKHTIKKNYGPVLLKDGINDRDLDSILDYLLEKKILKIDVNQKYSRGPLFWNYKDNIEREVADIKKAQQTFILWLIPLILSIGSLTLSIIKYFDEKKAEPVKENAKTESTNVGSAKDTIQKRDTAKRDTT